MRNLKPDIWKANFYQFSELYKPIIPSFHQLQHSEDQWPGLQEFQSLLNSHINPIKNELKIPVQFVDQVAHCNSFQDQYEPRIYLKGEVQTRLNNWHDFFQVLVWHTFPRTKVILNTLHYQASTKRLKENNENKKRTPTENFLTLFDECGIVIVSQNEQFLDMIKNFQWQQLFWKNRNSFNTSIECFTFGHAMYEKALSPYIGMTANALLIHVGGDFFKLNYNDKLRVIDDIMVKKIEAEESLTPKNLNPFPILGVPNWYKGNDNLDFYLNEKYFRKGRRKK